MTAPQHDPPQTHVLTIRRVRLGQRWWLIDLGDMVFALLIIGFGAWYLADALRASRAFQSLILIWPLSLFLFVTSALVIATAIRPDAAPHQQTPTQRRPRVGWRTLALMTLFTLYVATLPVLGFDGGTALFCAACLLVQGERNLVAVAGFAVGVGLLMGFIMSRGPVIGAPTIFL